MGETKMSNFFIGGLGILWKLNLISTWSTAWLNILYLDNATCNFHMLKWNSAGSVRSLASSESIFLGGHTPVIASSSEETLFILSRSNSNPVGCRNSVQYFSGHTLGSQTHAKIRIRFRCPCPARLECRNCWLPSGGANKLLHLILPYVETWSSQQTEVQKGKSNLHTYKYSIFSPFWFILVFTFIVIHPQVCPSLNQL